MRTHSGGINTCYDHRLLHLVATERFADLLIDDSFDEGGNTVVLSCAGGNDRGNQLRWRSRDHACETARLRHASVAEIGVEFGADEIIVAPQRRAVLLGTPLIVAEDHHSDRGPRLASDRSHLAQPERTCGISLLAAHRQDAGADDFGHYEQPQCLSVRPIDCINVHPDHVEDKKQLLEKHQKLHANIV